MKRLFLHALLCFIFLLNGELCFSQKKIPLLERTISITIDNERLDAALRKISQKGGFSFSYNPLIIDAQKIVSYNFVNKTLREILDSIFKGTIQYKERSRYIILTKAEISSVNKKNETKIVSGYVIDEATGEKLKNVSVYDPASLSSDVTDAYGYFQIEIDKPTAEQIKLAVNKFNYTDTLIVVPSNEPRLLNIPIKINADKFVTLADSVGQKLKRLWLRTKKGTEQSVNMQNIEDSIYRKFQFSVLPFVGTNGKLSGNVINDYSLNLFGGHSYGIKKLEFGGLFNTVSGDAQGIQVAGLFNTVAGKRSGWQMAGLINATRDSSRGAQLAGLVNFNLNTSYDFAAAGLLNFTVGDSRGAKLAGLANLTIGKQRGPHLAGLFNFTTKDSGPAQVAGLYNFTAGNITGAQVAGLFNFAAKNVHGAQVAPLINITGKSLHGAQVAGLINFASRVKGTQIGVLNISDSINGVPIGLLSFVRQGYHSIEVSADEIFYANIAFRTGVRKFYNILTAGMKPATLGEDNTVWTFGYGIGTSPRLNESWHINIDVTANQIMDGNIVDEINLLNKVYAGLDWQIAKNIAITFGITFNGYLTDNAYTEYPDLFTDYEPAVVNERNYSNDLNLKMWWGAKVGVRFF